MTALPEAADPTGFYSKISENQIQLARGKVIAPPGALTAARA
jgi:hypothetical protein